jgi:alpha-galactosidase
MRATSASNVLCVLVAALSMVPANRCTVQAAEGASSVVPIMAADLRLNREWAEAVFGGETTPGPANRLVVVHEDEPGDTKIGLCAFGCPMRLADKTFVRGIGVNSRSVLRVSLARPAAKFVAVIGLDRNVDNTAASVTMHVAVDGKDVLATPVIRPDGKARPIEVPLNGATCFDLVVNDGGDGRGWDQADWADARVILQDGSQVGLDDLARGCVPVPGLPFSFVYGGQSSSKLVAGWERHVQDETVDATRQRRVLTLTDPKTRLEVRAVCTIYTDSPGVDWTLTFTNRGEADTPVLEQVKAVDVGLALGLGLAPALHRLKGSTCAADDWQPIDEPLPAGKRVEFGAVNGRSSAESPFFTVEWGTAGVVTAVEWSGQWRGSIERGKGGELRIQAGMQHLRLSLRPGESIRSPRIMQVYWSGGDTFHGCNLFRRTMLNHVIPRVGGAPVTPPIVHLSTSFYELNSSTEANVLSHLEAIRGLGFEMFWLDAYWTRDGFPAGMGHYGFPIERVEPRDRFPRGLKPIGQAARKEGMRYLMWFEPERVHPGTLLAKEHPEWVISPGGDGSGLYNLGIPEAREYMTRYLIAAIREYGLDCLRIDYNIDPLSFWEFLNRKDASRVGLGEIRYVEGLYRMWDDILKACPSLFIDNCASGGRRIDLETCSRSIPLWRSDNTCDMLDGKPQTVLNAAIKNQLMSAGLNRYVPFSIVGQMGATPYLFRSGFNGGIAFAQDCRPADAPRDLLKQAIAEGKRIRKYWSGDFYPMSDVTLGPTEWCVMQYHRPSEQDGLIVAFRRPASPYASYDSEPRGIEPAGEYDVTLSQGYQPSDPVKMKGDALRRLQLRIDERPGSLLVEYRRLK